MKIKIEQIKRLREATGARVMDCKKALEASEGKMKEARQWLAQKGKIRAKKKKGEETPEGLVYAYIHAHGKVGAMVKLGCQTDFVSRHKDFQKLAHELCLQIASMNPQDEQKLKAQEYIRDPKKTINDLLEEAIAKFGENIKVEDFARFEV